MGVIANIIDKMNINLDIAYGRMLSKIFTFINSPELQETLFSVKIVFLAVSAIFVVFMIIILLRTHYLQWLFVQDWVEFLTHRPFGAKRITRGWDNILKRLDTGVESEYKLAVIEADDLMDTSLRRLGYTGATLDERLQKLTSATLPNLSQVLEAHKIRNNVVHNPDYRLSLDEAKKTLGIYEEAFKDLQILEK